MRLYSLDHRPGRVLHLEGKEYLYFSGTSYLGIDQVPEYQEILLACIRRYGFNHGLSRVNNLRLRVFDEFEGFFAEQAGASAGVVTSSGYLSGIMAWQYLSQMADEVWTAPGAHPAIVPIGSSCDKQLNLIQWKELCLEVAMDLSPRRILILGNAVDPLKVEIYDNGWVSEIAKKHEVTLLIDDSHAFGVIGKDVFGTYSFHKCEGMNLVVAGSMGKGLAMPAGIILGEKEVIEGIRSQAIFSGASPCSPANLQAFLDTQPIYFQKAELIRAYSKAFFEKIQDLSTVYGSSEFPVFVYDNPNWAEQLEDQGFITSSFSYPKADSPRVSRIVLSGGHTETDLVRLSEALYQLVEKE